VAGGANDNEIEHLLQFGLKLGLVFQIADDILDVSGTTEQLGKTAGKDAVQGKVTYPAVVGLDESRRMAVEMTEKAMLALYIFGKKADTLRGLAGALLDRTR
jgi:geranylgeranyl diphosphate synthase type II